MRKLRLSPAAAVAAVLSAAALLIGATGCASSDPKPPKQGPSFSYVVKLADSLKGQKFKVDVVPVNASNKDRITSMSIDDYFNNKDGLRDGISNVKSQMLSPGDTMTVDLADKGSKELGKYRFPGYSHIAIIADSSVRGSSPANDQRRILLPLDPTLWQRDWPTRNREITVTFSSAGVESSPGPIAK